MKSVERVLIVGGGIGGVCRAVALRDAGVEAHIVEIKPEWTVYGVGIIQQSNVVRAMAQVGLVDDYLDAAFPFDNVTIYAPHGALLATLPGRRLAGTWQMNHSPDANFPALVNEMLEFTAQPI